MADSCDDTSDTSSYVADTSSTAEDKSVQDRLLEALIHNNIEDFKHLLRDPQADPKHYYRGSHGKPNEFGTLLEIASRKSFGQPFVQELLKKVPPNVNKLVPEPIHYAAKKGHSDVLDILLRDRRTKVNAHDSKGRTALHMACMFTTPKRIEDYVRCVRLLMSKFSKCDVNRTDIKGFSAIHTAVCYRNKKVKSVRDEDGDNEEASEKEIADARHKLISTILELGREKLDIDSVRANGRTARDDLMKFYPDLEKLLPNSEGVFHHDPHSALVNALRDRRIEMFKALLEQTDEDGNPRLDPNHWYEAPIHATCLELACKKRDGEEFVKALVNAGADPNLANRFDEKFPIHFACEKALLRNLKALFESTVTNPNSTDKDRNTPLHYIVKKLSQSPQDETRECLKCLLSRENIDLNRTNKEGNTPLMIALNSNLEFVVEQIINRKGKCLNLSLKLGDRELKEIIEEKYPELADKLCPSFDQTPEKNENDLFQSLYKSQEKEFTDNLKILIHNNLDGMPDLLNKNDEEFTLLQRAAKLGMIKSVDALLQAGADPNGTFKASNKTPPAILAILNRHYSVVEVFLKNEKFKVNELDSKGNTVLYYATRNPEESFEIILKLLEHGADPTIRNKLGKVCFDPERLQSALDHCVQTNGKNPRHEKYEIILDYRLLTLNSGKYKRNERESVPNSVPEEQSLTQIDMNDNQELRSEMHFLHLMSKNDDIDHLLNHPVASSFLQMKWDRVKILAYVNLGIYIAFVLFLNIFIINSGLIKDYFAERNSSDSSSAMGDFRTFPLIIGIPLAIITLILWLYLLLREIVQFILDQEKYFKSYENYMDWSVLMFSAVAVLMPIIQPNNQIIPVVNVLSIMLSSTELLVLLGRISQFAKYIEMLKVVVRNYFWPLMSYCVIVIAFGLSFHTLLSENSSLDSSENTNSNMTDVTGNNSSNGFDVWYVSIVKTFVMMTGELDYDTFPQNSILSIVLFLAFLLLVTIILLNLLIGLAVSDTQKIEADAKTLLLKTRIEVVLYAESILVNLYNADCWIFRKLTTSRKLRRRLEWIVLFPGVSNEKRMGHVRPNETAQISLGDAFTEGHPVDREWLEDATQIISKRSGRKAESEVTLESLNESLNRIYQIIKHRGDTVREEECQMERHLSVGSIDDRNDSVFD